MQIRRAAVAAFLTILTAGVCFADTFETISRATVRISTVEKGKAYFGSGTVIDNEDDVEILTNYHVSGPVDSEVKVEFFLQGDESDPAVNGVVTWADEENDLAVVTVDEENLSGYQPTEIDIAERDLIGHMITMGCPSGNFPSALNGRFNGDYTRWGMAVFTPRPAAGRSGSGIFFIEDDEPVLVAVVTMRQKFFPKSYDRQLEPFDGRYSTSGFGYAVPISDYLHARNALWVQDEDAIEANQRLRGLFPNVEDESDPEPEPSFDLNLKWQKEEAESDPDIFERLRNVYGDSLDWLASKREAGITVAIAVALSLWLSQYFKPTPTPSND